MIFVFLVLNLFSHAREVISAELRPQPLSKSADVVELGGCKPQVLSKKEPEEYFARKAAEEAGLSKEEILARIIYSEALSSGYWRGKCHAQSGEDVMRAVGWGVMNRVKRKAKNSLDAYSDVVFAKNQFRTSFSSKKENPFAVAFLCPLKSQGYLSQGKAKPSAGNLYKETQDVAKKIIEDYEQSGIPTEYKGITNFFYPQSEFFGELRPSWAKNPDPTKNKGYVNILNVAEKPCVEYYRLK